MSNNTTTKSAIKTAVKDTVDKVTDDNNQSKIFDSAAHKRNLHNAQEALVSEFHTLMADTERLLNHTKEVAEDQSQELRESIEKNLDRAREILQERHQQWSEQSSELKERAEAYIQEKPWQSIGIAAGVGLLMGLILRR